MDGQMQVNPIDRALALLPDRRSRDRLDPRVLEVFRGLCREERREVVYRYLKLETPGWPAVERAVWNDEVLIRRVIRLLDTTEDLWVGISCYTKESLLKILRRLIEGGSAWEPLPAENTK